MINELRELFKYRELIKQLVLRDLKVRYKNSALGFLWSLLNPLVQVATITIVMKFVMRIDIPNYSAYLLVGYLPWMFFQMALLDSSQVILLHRDLLRKVYFPREVLPISVVIANLIHFLLALVIFFAYLVIYIHFILHGSGLLITTLWLPILIAMQVLLIAGLAFFVSCLNVFYEDTKYMLMVTLNVMFYLTPVMYVSEMVYTRIPGAYRTLLYKLYMLSPVNMLTDAYRKTLLPSFCGGAPGHKMTSIPLDYGMLAICAVICIGIAVAGYAFFNARKWIFAERM